MRLKILLKYISSEQDVQILLYQGSGQEEILFEGAASDVPWIYADMDLDNDSGDGEAIFSFINEKNESVIGIYIEEK